jgi:hypothetical protein
MSSETKEIIVKSVKFNREYKPQGKSFVIYYFNMQAEDKAGNILNLEFSTNQEVQTKFLEGNTYEVIITEKSNRGGVYYFADYSAKEKEKNKVKNSNRSTKPKGYARPYSEIMSIVAQSSYHNAVMLIDNIQPESINETKMISILAKSIMGHIVKISGLDSEECKNDDKYAMIKANRKSIVMQKSFAIVCDCVDWPNFEPLQEGENMTKRIIRIADKIFEDINEMSNGF